MSVTKDFGLLGLVLLISACVPLAAQEPVESLNPLFTEGDLVFDPALLGDWGEKDKEGLILRFQALPTSPTSPAGEDAGAAASQSPGAKAYKLAFIKSKDEHVAKYEARLVRLGTMLYLDVAPEEPLAIPDSFNLLLVQSETEAKFEPRLSKVAPMLYLDLAPVAADDEGGPDEDAYELRLLPAHQFFRAWIEGGVLRLAQLDGYWLRETIDQGKASLNHERVGTSIVLTASTRELREFLQEHADDEGAFSRFQEWHRRR